MVIVETSDARKRLVERQAQGWAESSIFHKEDEHDPVSKPAHYTHSKIEVWDAIDAWGLNYFLGNVVKYVARADRKGNAVQDLLKAKAYIEKELARRSPKQDGGIRTGSDTLHVAADRGYLMNTLDEHGRFQSNLPPRVERES